MIRQARQRARRRGRIGEAVAALWLRLSGYSVLARGFAVGRGAGAGEVDLIARRGRRVVFVEVKLRPSLAEAAEALRPQQRRRILRGAEAFLARRPELAGCEVRFDAILLAPWHWPRHLRDAWRKGT